MGVMRVSSIFVLFLLLVSSAALAYAPNSDGVSFNCTSCADCTAALSDGSRSTVYLVNDIIDHNGSCIANPGGFDNKTFDCLGNTIDSDGAAVGYGFLLQSQDDNTIRNCEFTGFMGFVFVPLQYSAGVVVMDGDNNTIHLNEFSSNLADIGIIGGAGNIVSNNTLTGALALGMLINATQDITIEGNEVSQVAGLLAGAMQIGFSDGVDLISNRVHDNAEAGISIGDCANVLMSDNIMTDNNPNFALGYSTYEHLNHTILPDNLVQGKRMYYNLSVEDYTFNPTTAPDAGMLYCISCRNITVNLLNLSARTSHGLLLVSNDSFVSNVTAWNATNSDIYLLSSHNNFLIGVGENINIGDSSTNNTVRDSALDGISVNGDDNYILSNEISVSAFLSGDENTMAGNALDGGVGVAGDDNNISNNTFDGGGISIYSGYLNQVIGNHIIRGSLDIAANRTFAAHNHIDLDDPRPQPDPGGSSVTLTGSHNVLEENTMVGGHRGLYIDSSYNNLTDNTMGNNSAHGIFLYSGAEFNNFTGNIIQYNGWNITDYSVGNAYDSGMYVAYNTGGANYFFANNLSNNYVGIGSMVGNWTMVSNYFDNIHRNFCGGISSCYGPGVMPSNESYSTTLGSTLNFTVYAVNLNNTPASTYAYEIETRPSEPVFATVSGNKISASFTPSRQGVYMMLVRLTDDLGNVQIMRRYVFVDAVETKQVVRFYMRGTNSTDYDLDPQHGNDLAAPGTHLGALRLEPPMTHEYVYCGAQIYGVTDEIPEVDVFMPYYVKDVNTTLMYHSCETCLHLSNHLYGGGGPVCGSDFWAPIPASAENNTIEVNMNTNFTIESLASWYAFEYDHGGIPFCNNYWHMNATNRTFSDYAIASTGLLDIINATQGGEEIALTRQQSVFPPKTELLSLTEQDDGVLVQLDGHESTTLTFELKDDKSHYIYYDGEICLPPDCTYTQNGNILEVTVALGSPHEIFIAAADDYISNSSGAFCNSCESCTAALDAPNATDVYLTADISSDGICIDDPTNFNNKTFDCQGNSIQGDGSLNKNHSALYLQDKSGNTIRGCNISAFGIAILLNGSDGNVIVSNDFSFNWADVALDNGSDDNGVWSNTHGHNTYGIYSNVSYGNTIHYNTLQNCSEYCIISSGSNTTQIKYNSIQGGTILSLNSVDDELEGNEVDASQYGIILWGATGTSVGYNNISNMYDTAVGMVASSGMVLGYNNITLSKTGIGSMGSSGYYVSHNLIDAETGFSNVGAEGDVIINDNLFSGNGTGAKVDSDSTGNFLLIDNSFTNIPRAIELSGQDIIALNNSIQGSVLGINISGGGSHEVVGNSITSTSFGIDIESGYNDIKNNSLIGLDTGINLTYHDNTLSGNRIESCADYGLYIQQALGASPGAGYNLVSGNLINNSPVYYAPIWMGIYDRPEFINNIFTNYSWLAFDDLYLHDIYGEEMDGFTYSVWDMRPSVAVAFSSEENDLRMLAPSSDGLYTFGLAVTDARGNTYRGKADYYAGVADEQTLRYYLREADPTHGQGIIGPDDVGSLNLAPPVSEEDVRCMYGIVLALDEISGVFEPAPTYHDGKLEDILILKDMNSSFIFETTPAATNVIGLMFGVVEVGNLLEFKGYFNATDNLSRVDSTLTANKALTDLTHLYNVTLKFGRGDTGTYPILKSYADDASYADITFAVHSSGFPQISGMDPASDVEILSFVRSGGDYLMELEGDDTATITFTMPDDDTYSVDYDGSACSAPSCDYDQSGDQLEVTVVSGSEHELLIESVSDYVINASGAFCDSCESCTAALDDLNATEVYLTADISSNGSCVAFPSNASSKTFDCRGHTISSLVPQTGTAISLQGATQSRVSNCSIDSFNYGLDMLSSYNNSIVSNEFASNTFDAVMRRGSDNNDLRYNEHNDGYVAVLATGDSDYNDIVANTLSNCTSGYCIVSNSSEGNKIWSNTAVGGSIVSFGSEATSIRYNILSDNDVGVLLWSAPHNELVYNNFTASGTAAISMVAQTDGLISDNKITDCNSGVEGLGNSNVTISGNIVNDTVYGVYLKNNGGFMNIIGNEFRRCEQAIYFPMDRGDSLYDNISGNLFEDNTYAFSSGVCLWEDLDCHGSVVSGNIFRDNAYPTHFYQDIYYNYPEREWYVFKDNYFENNTEVKTVVVNDLETLNISVYTFNGLPSDFDYTVYEMNPDEPLSFVKQAGPSGLGQMLYLDNEPSKEGLHSTLIEIEDSDGNRVIDRYYFFNGYAEEDIDMLYFRGNQTHGDMGNITPIAPTGYEQANCFNWVLFNFNITPELLPHYLLDMDMFVHWYIGWTPQNGTFVGFPQAYFVPGEHEGHKFIRQDIGPHISMPHADVMMSSVQDWDYLWLQFHAPFIYPLITTTPEDPSYANLTLATVGFIDVLEMSGDVEIHSVTKTETSDGPRVELEFREVGASSMIIDMFEDADWQVFFDGSPCSGGVCSYTRSDSWLNITTDKDGDRTLLIKKPPRPPVLLFNVSFDNADPLEDTANGYESTAFGDPGLVNGAVGDGYSFDGDDYVSTDLWLMNYDRLAIDFMVRFDQLNPNTRIIFNKYGGVGLFLTNDLQMGVMLRNNTNQDFCRLISDAPIHHDKWYRVIATFDGDVCKLDVGGVVNTAAPGSATGTFKSGPMRLAFDPYQQGNELMGALDEVKIYDMAIELPPCDNDGVCDPGEELYSCRNDCNGGGGLLLNMTFDEGDFTDYESGYDGVAIGDPVLISGAIGDAYEFDGDDYISTDLQLNSFDEATIDLIVSFDQLKPNSRIITNKYGGVGLSLNHEDKIFFSLVNNDNERFCNLASDLTIQHDKWYRVIATFDGDECKLDVGGVVNTAAPGPATGTFKSGPMRLAFDPTPLGNELMGALDEVKIYDRAIELPPCDNDGVCDPGEELYSCRNDCNGGGEHLLFNMTFDEEDFTEYESGYDGVPEGAFAFWDTGNSSKWAYFNQSNQSSYVKTDFKLYTLDEFKIKALVLVNDNSYANRIFSTKYAGTTLSFDPQGRLIFTVLNNQNEVLCKVQGTSELLEGQWAWMTLEFGEDECALEINGERDAANRTTASGPVKNGPLWLGYSSVPGYFFSGSMEYFEVWVV